MYSRSIAARLLKQIGGVRSKRFAGLLVPDCLRQPERARPRDATAPRQSWDTPFDEEPGTSRLQRLAFPRVCHPLMSLQPRNLFTFEEKAIL
jgi:hypothetical protein